ncbi:HesA/MoeB/ThiF family protein [Gulosibacter bifidus]|uniref:ThiF family adenylyltransferase n=1 Tax=Gulosibacter bifidus TaxID=272239 RepID=A0ABW5RJL6_9MICO|nr:HesA/MoeB/ThiF family protein [Gulosibacter bifidus]
MGIFQGDGATAAEREDAQARHRRLLGYGESGVRSAAGSHIAVVGAGGLGCPALLSLAAAGVGTLTIIDDDAVEASNLARQTLYRRSDIGVPKVEAAARALAETGARIVTRRIRITPENAHELLATADVVLDTTDQWPTRFAVADAAARLGVPLVWGSALGWDGLLTVFAPGGPQLDDLVDREGLLAATDAPNCASTGVFAPLTAEIGGAMAGEALRIVTTSGSPLVGLVRSWDARHGRVRELPLAASAGTEPAAKNATRNSDPAPTGAVTTPGPATGTADRAHRIRIDELPDDAFVLDVRPALHPDLPVPRPYAHVPLETLEASMLSGALDLPDSPIAVVCAMGPRARAAAELLRDAGYPEVSTLDGGVAALAAILPDSSAT